MISETAFPSQSLPSSTMSVIPNAGGPDAAMRLLNEARDALKDVVAV